MLKRSRGGALTRERRETPALGLLEQELKRRRYRSRFLRVMRSTIYALVVTAAVAVLVATLWMPVLKIYGSSMAPTLSEGDIVVSLNGGGFKTGDLVGFYVGNKLLVKRCIAGPRDWIDFDADGNVFINGEPLDEPYVSEKAFGECDLDLPFQVPDERWFLMGDHPAVSVDSRSTLVTCTPYGVNSHRLLIRGHRVSDRPGRTVRVTADAARIEPIIVTPVAAIPMLAVLLLWLLLRDAYITRRDRAREKVRREWKNRHSE